MFWNRFRNGSGMLGAAQQKTRSSEIRCTATATEGVCRSTIRAICVSTVINGWSFATISNAWLRSCSNRFDRSRADCIHPSWSERATLFAINSMISTSCELNGVHRTCGDEKLKTPNTSSSIKIGAPRYYACCTVP